MADLAKNQSVDRWSLLDKDGAEVAFLTTEAGWTLLGEQNLDKWDNTNDVLLDFSAIPISALALHLSDFSGLTTANAGTVTSMEIQVSSNGAPKTDYAFISSDVNSIQFSNQVAPVPVPAAVWLFGTGLIGLIGVRRKKVVA